jgi:hypothetical protein
MSTAFDPQAAQEIFDDFLFKMDDQIEGLQREASRHGVVLNLTDASVGRLEKLFDLLAPPQVSADVKSNYVVTFGRYLGEVMRLNHRGHWHLPLDDPKNVYFNQPVITGHRSAGVVFAPISVMRAYAVRRKVGTVSTAFRNHADPNPNPLNLSDLAEE